MKLRHALVPSLILTLALILTGCGRGITLTTTNNCDHPIDAQVFVYDKLPGERRGAPFSDSGDVVHYAVGQTEEMFFHIGTFTDLYAEIITNADGTARADHFADGHDLPNDYTISGAMCLTPAATTS